MRISGRTSPLLGINRRRDPTPDSFRVHSGSLNCSGCSFPINSVSLSKQLVERKESDGAGLASGLEGQGLTGDGLQPICGIALTRIDDGAWNGVSLGRGFEF